MPKLYRCRCGSALRAAEPPGLGRRDRPGQAVLRCR